MEWLGVTEDQVHVTNSKRDTDLTGRQFSCLIASYNFLGQLERHDKDLDFKIVVMDEAHYIKNKKVCLALSYHLSLGLCLPGFPAQSKVDQS